MKKVISLVILVTILFSNFTYAEAAKIWSKYVAKVVPKEEKANGSTGTGKTNVALEMTAHMSMMQIQQMTFNTYMWSRGFNYLPATGKMW